MAGIERGGRTDTRQRRQWQKLSKDPGVVEDISGVTLLFSDSVTGQSSDSVGDPEDAGLESSLIADIFMDPPSMEEPEAPEGIYEVLAVVTTTYTASLGELVRCDPTTLGFTVNLPSAVGAAGRSIIIKNASASTNTITIDGASAETIDGAATATITTAYGVVSIVSDGTNWLVV